MFESALLEVVETVETETEQSEVEKRLQEGQRKQRQEDILRILEVRFNEVPRQLRERIGAIEDLEVLGTLLIQAVTAQSLDVFESIFYN
ncbi:hypothetical protein H6G50_06210 [Oscillatoria sp. FACHB-1406]|nr:hypothetical protein [Oscillatoria sp. FACHB-1406]